VSPQIVTGALTYTQFGSCYRISFARSTSFCSSDSVSSLHNSSFSIYSSQEV